jgi:hypothetical protein
MEFLVLGMAVVMPWLFGGGEPAGECLQYVVTALLVGLWVIPTLLERHTIWQNCTVVLCLALLLLLGLWQLTPLPRSVLAFVSPTTARLYETLLPSEPEVLGSSASQSASLIPAAGTAISLNPGATRRQVVKLLAFFLLFVVVRQSLVSVSRLKRLSVVLTLNGTFLALLGLLQFFSGTRNLFWTYPTVGPFFGTFNARNGLAYHLNLCLGLGLGLLFMEFSRLRRAGGREESGHGELRLFLDPGVLFLLCPVVIIAMGLVYIQARAGLIACAVAFMLLLTLDFGHMPRRVRLIFLGLFLVVMVTFTAWTGFSWNKSRVAELVEGGKDGGDLSSGRLRLWAQAFATALEYLPWGTGFGTSSLIDLSHGAWPFEDGSFGFQPHNVYLEALLEGGPLALTLGVVTLGIVLWLGYRACWHMNRLVEGALPAGALFAVTTLAVHNFFDNGLHIPANGLLATLICAQLSGLGAKNRVNSSPQSRESTFENPSGHAALRKLVPVAFALPLVAAAVFLAQEGWRVYRAQQYLLAALELSGKREESAINRRVALLEEAACLFPDSWRIHNEIGEACLDRFYQSNTYETLARRSSVRALAVVVTGTPSLLINVASDAETQKEWRRLMAPALPHFLRARNLCPLAAAPQIRIAALAYLLERGDPATVYRSRASSVLEADPWLGFLCGLEELRGDRPRRAAEFWRRCLLCLKEDEQESVLREMAIFGASRFSPEKCVQELIPPQPALLARAALLFYPGSRNVDARRPFLNKIDELFHDHPSDMSAKDHYLHGVLREAQGQPIDAVRSMKSALALDPGRNEWRLEYARLLFRNHLFREARREVEAVMARTPENDNARQLWKEIMRAAPPQ